MNNLYEALEVCLEAIEQGTDIEVSLALYPDIADELRPIIQASVIARQKSAPAPSMDVMQRNRARLFQRAAEIRETIVRPPSTRIWFSSARRLAAALVILLVIFMSGTGLVRASSGTLPGDNLYPVKRTWEDVTLLFTFDMQRRESLEVEHENERLEELHALMSQGRSAKVEFVGIVTQQNRGEWLVAGIRIVISPQTDLQDGPVFVGDSIRVFGITQSDNSVIAERIEHLPSDAKLPDVMDSDNASNGESNSGSGSSNNDNGSNNVNENDSSGPGSGNDNSNDNNSGPGSVNDNGNNIDSNSGPGGGNDNENINSSGSGGSNDNSSGSGSSNEIGNDNSNEDNSGPGGGSENDYEDNSNSGSGGGGD